MFFIFCLFLVFVFLKNQLNLRNKCGVIQNRCVVDIVIVLNISFRKDIVLNKLFYRGSFYSTRSDGLFLTILESI